MDGLHPYFRNIWDPKVQRRELWRKSVSNDLLLGSGVLAWNTNAVKGKLDSWQALADPKYKGKTAILDQSTEMFGALSLMLERT